MDLDSDSDSDVSLDLDQLDREVQQTEEQRDKEACHHELDYDAVGKWVYPTNFPIRSYQYDIVENALFQNVLCALPTGLGKTFIASTVMLNWYRWTKSAKIIFMAPTRPLVSQQVEACLGITGIPKEDVSVLIGGSMSPKLRALEWQLKRVFFATPQTVENDIKKGVIHPREIVLMVIDEAHRATGRYSYVEVVEFVSQLNKHFRILSLTATPSTTVEGVQLVLSNLRVSKAEIRTEDSEDIKPHVHEREMQRITTEPLPIQESIMELFIEAVHPLVREMTDKGALTVETEFLNSFVVLSQMQKWCEEKRDFRDPSCLRIQGVLILLISLARAMTLLKIHGIRQFYDKMMAIKQKADEPDPEKKPSKALKDFCAAPALNAALDTCKQHLWKNGQIDASFLGHAKLERLVEEMNDFFDEMGEDSRAIVFVEFRESAAEVCRAMAHNCQKVKPHLFIGQQGQKDPKSEEPSDTAVVDEGEEIAVYDEHGAIAKKGMRQKIQQQVVKEFKQGKYNVLVATSIGEEGLDIGQVDLIVCYDQSRSPIRALQRMGRTGRKRAGKIIMLMANNEEKKLDHALGGYKYIQQLIDRGQGEFEYEPVDRILPERLNPRVDKRHIEIGEQNRQVLAGERTTELVEQWQQANLTQRVNIDRTLPAVKRRWFLPEGVETGFVTASSIDKPTAVRPAQLPQLEPSQREQATTRTPARVFAKPKQVTAPETIGGYLSPQQRLELNRKYPKPDLRYRGVEFPFPVPASSSAACSTGTLIPHSRHASRFLQLFGQRPDSGHEVNTKRPCKRPKHNSS